MKPLFLLFLAITLGSCSNKFIEFEPFNYETNDSAKINVKGIKGCSFKLVGNKLYYKQKIKLRNSGMPKRPEENEPKKESPKTTERDLMNKNIQREFY